MSYYGEKGKFSFRDNFCEETEKAGIGELADFGELLGKIFRRIAVGTERESLRAELYTLAGGIARGGCDVFMMNDTVPVFRYGIRSAECDCGVYLCGDEKLRMIFFDSFGINMPSVIMEKIYSASPEDNRSESGRISVLSHIRELYINSLRDIVSDKFKGNAVISCGNRRISDMWRIFFSSDKGDVIFQVSEDGSRVNCYGTDFGFIAYERLVLAYALSLWEKGECVVLPEGFHYAGEELAKKINARCIYQNVSNHAEIFKQRFTFDSLFLCIGLLNCGKSISDMVKKLPEFYTARREIATDFSMRSPERTIRTPEGKIKLSRSGKNRLTLIVQTMNMETSAELCGKWERLILERNEK